MPDKKPNRISVIGKSDAVVVQFFGKKPQSYYYAVFMNPYSGQVLKVKNMKQDFFSLVLDGHMHLWLPAPVSGYIVQYATLIFLLIQITGIVLWWPRKAARIKSSFKIKLKASPKRLNYDLHNVLGFYASWVILFAVLTGLVWSFDWVADTEYWMFSGGKSKPAFKQPQTAITTIGEAEKPLGKIFTIVVNAYPAAASYLLVLPLKDSAAVVVKAYHEKGKFYNSDNLYFNQYTAAQLPVAINGKYSAATVAEKATRMNYDIHVGAIAGLPGRLLMFFAAIICASLPVTGFYIWWGKWKRGKNKGKVAVKHKSTANHLSAVNSKMIVNEENVVSK